MKTVKQISLAEYAGFCSGVRKAVDLVYETIKKYPDRNIYTLGPIVHNPQLVASLEEKGVRVADIDDLKPGDVAIVRSHGAPSSTYEKAKKKGVILIDASCPFVKRAQNYAKMLNDEGYSIVIIGEEDHPEVRAVLSHAGKGAVVIGSNNNVQEKLLNKSDKLGILSQTTQSLKNFKEVIVELLTYAHEFKIYNTICGATTRRQNSATKLAHEVDLMIVVGGYHSSNTTKLAELCSAIVETHHIEKPDELKPEWFKDKQKIGLTAGASTPEFVIKGVLNQIEEI